VLPGCKSPGPASVQQSYDDCRLKLNRGELKEALAEANSGLRHFPSEDTKWHWQFRLLKAEILVRQRFSNEALALLEPELPAPLQNGDLAVWRKLTQGMARAFLLQFDDATGLLAQAEALASTNAPYLEGEVALRKGTLAFLREEWATAEAEYHKTLAISLSQNDRFLEVAALGSLGLIATRQEHYDESIEWNRKALALSQSVGAKDSESYILGNLGWSYFEIGDYEQARELLEQAEASSSAVGSAGAQIDWLIDIAGVDYYLHDYIGAEQTSEKALALARKLDERVEMVYCLNQLSGVALKRNQLELAERYNEEALKVSRASQDRLGELSSTLIEGRIAGAKRDYREAERLLKAVASDRATQTSLKWEAECRLAGIYETAKLTLRAKDQYHKSIETIERARTSIKDEELRVPFLSNAIEFYEDYLGFLISHHRIEDALEVAELSRARTLAEGLGMRANSLSSRLRNFNPQALARRMNATLLFYWIGPERSYLWVITPSALSYFALPKQSEIDPVLKAHRQAILGGRDLLASEGAGGGELYEMLIAPAHNLIPKASRVIVLPSEGLYGLNFETLIVPQPKPHYWIEDAIVSEASSLALLSAANQKASSNEKSLLLVGNPETPGPDFPLLPQAAEEIQKVSMHFPEPRRKILEGRQATASAYLQSNPERFSYLHFVTHGTASQTRPLESAVILTKEGDSYKLYARDIVTHPLKADLVTISACNGAGTRAYAGEGLVGLSWAFLRAGAHNVIASLWEVSDASSTAQLMDALYRDLDHGADPATALRNAKLFILKSNSNTVFRKPFYWAPFQLYAGS